MGDKVKLIIEISEHEYEICKQALKDFGDRPITEREFAIAVGTPLDDVKAEIESLPTEKIARCRKAYIFASEYKIKVLEILDSIGKENKE